MAGLPTVPGAAKDYTDITTIFNDQSLSTTLQTYLDEAVRCKQRIQDENLNIKDLREKACEELQIKPKLFNAMVAVLFNNDAEDRLEELGQVEMAIHGLMQVSGQ